MFGSNLKVYFMWKHQWHVPLTDLQYPHSTTWYYQSLISDHSHCLLSCLLTSCVSCVSSGAAAGPRLNNNQLYKFSYTTEVLVDRIRGSREGSAGYKISTDVDVNLVWRDPSSKDDQLIQLVVCWSSYMYRTWCHFKSLFITTNTPLIKLVAKCVHNRSAGFPSHIYLSFIDLKREDRPCVPPIREEERPPWIHCRKCFGEDQTSSSD